MQPSCGLQLELKRSSAKGSGDDGARLCLMLGPLRQPPRWLTHSKEDQHEGSAKKISTGALSAEKGVELRARRWPDNVVHVYFIRKSSSS
jgi:hypothetical protein